MSERKVLNKYYPPDFDPSKIPKGKRNRNATFNIRIMAPFNMRCNTCKDYIYKGKKFNSRKEDVMDEDYLGLKIFRFYIKCPRCVSEIAFKTDLLNTDYTLEAGATRLFEAEKLAQQMAEQERKEKEEDEMNPMKVLENRTKASRLEMEQIDSLEELRELNSRKNVVNTDEMIEKYRKYEETLQQLQMEQEEKEIQLLEKDELRGDYLYRAPDKRQIFGDKCTKVVKRLHDSDSDDEGPVEKKLVVSSTASKPTDILAEETKEPKGKVTQSWERSVGSMTSKNKLKGLVVKKKTALPVVTSNVQKDSKAANVTNVNSDLQTNGTNRAETTADVRDNRDPHVKSQTENENKNVCSAQNNARNSENSTNRDSNVMGNGQAKESISNETFKSEANVVGQTKALGIGSLGLLGDYADSDSENSE